MLTGKALCETLMTELNDMGLPGMSATLDGMYRSPDFIHLDPLMAIATLVEPEYQKKMTKRIQSRLRSAICKAVRRSFRTASTPQTGSTCPAELPRCSPRWTSSIPA